MAWRTRVLLVFLATDGRRGVIPKAVELWICGVAERRYALLPNHAVELPNLKSFQQIVIEKQQSDVFTNPNKERVLNQFRARMLILLYGVASEIVAQTANALWERGHRVELKITHPGSKQVYRFRDQNGNFGGDIIACPTSSSPRVSLYFAR